MSELVLALHQGLWDASDLEAVLWLSGGNLLMFVLSLLIGGYWVRKCKETIGPPAGPLDRTEIIWASIVVPLNAAVGVLGWWLWKKGWIVTRTDAGLRAWLDVLVLFFAMDLGMYLLHRIGHHPWLYPVFHGTHHRYTSPKPIDLFVLNPAEVCGYGGLWLVVLYAYPASMLGILVYLSFNLAFGTLGHLGVEPFPIFRKHRALRWVGTSTFHAQHHQDEAHNFGFYTTLWDRLFKTLSPRY